ncbi:MAG: two component transcriptional regulator, AraC family [Clostridia bacterium]|jgi:two-component system response regulator YesN|nr:two component transcriptional regulator, AraC family [Clostridia bacterium]
MLKVLIADDEPKIRRGIKKSLNWNELGMKIVAEAEDGEIALEMAREFQPDILLVDICMPFLNGLQFVERLYTVLADCIVIIITGHDEFTYAQQALKLRVFDYLLKPVDKAQLRSIVTKAGETLEKTRLTNKYTNWARQQLEKNFSVLKEKFLNQWVNGHLTGEEVKEQMKFFNIEFCSDMGMIVIKTVEKLNIDELIEEWDRHLLLYAIQNIVEELLQDWGSNLIFRDNKDNIVAITPVKQISEWGQLGTLLEMTVEKYLKQIIIVSQKRIEDGILSVPSTYESLITDIKERSQCTPVVLLARKYIDTYYYKEDLSLQEVANEVRISSTYLSRLLKQETGVSFIDYLTQVRIKKAIELINDPSIKIYEVAERVGYSSQHYFSTAFKKIFGVSPLEYRKGEKAINE